jgi:hypothetical protein
VGLLCIEEDTVAYAQPPRDLWQHGMSYPQVVRWRSNTRRGRPKRVPLVLACLSPAETRSLISSRSNSATAARMWSSRRDVGFAESVSKPPRCRDEPHARRRQLLDARDAVHERPAEAIQLHHDHHINLALARIGHQCIQAWPLRLRTAHLILINTGQFPHAPVHVVGQFVDLDFVALVARAHSCIDRRSHAPDSMLGGLASQRGCL